MAHCRKPTRSLGSNDAWVFFLKVTHFLFHEVKPKEKEITKLGVCRLAKLCLEGLLSSHSKERLTFGNYFPFELASVPMALINSDGSLSKTNKESW